jgi:hypothetical protein
LEASSPRSGNAAIKKRASIPKTREARNVQPAVDATALVVTAYTAGILGFLLGLATMWLVYRGDARALYAALRARVQNPSDRE